MRSARSTYRLTTIASASFSASSAAALSPAAAEDALKDALALAPANGDVHWRMANLLVREGKLSESLDHFKAAIGYNGDLFGATLDLIWRASRGNVDAVTRVTGEDPKAKLKLARFLLQQSRVAEAVAVLSSVDRSARLASSDSPAFLNSLIAGGQFEVAHGLWSSIVGDDAHSALIWNGGFESDILRDFAQFDWSFAPSEYARLNIDATVAHSGSRSLKIAFAGRDTTNLDNGVKQLVMVQPGVHYKIECYVKTSELVTSEGPKVAVTASDSGELLVESNPVAAGSSDWQPLSVVFVAPLSKSGDSSAVYVSIKRKPKYSYDEPTKGSVWYDDFTMRVSNQ
ncbi:MAG TPA: carbohydrate binding domain-containing protein [Blastocatellia bacterium]|nr:carbohydrate binding domain-containing protein [Blastocatellia bacterium]